MKAFGEAMALLFLWIVLMGLANLARAHTQCTPWYGGCIWEHEHSVGGFLLDPSINMQSVVDSFMNGVSPITDFTTLCPSLPPTVDPADFECTDSHPTLARCCLNWERVQNAPTPVTVIPRTSFSDWMCQPLVAQAQAKVRAADRCYDELDADDIGDCRVTNGSFSIMYPMFMLGEWRVDYNCPESTHPRGGNRAGAGAEWRVGMQCDCKLY